MVSEPEQNAEILEALANAGLTETYVDEDGHEVMRLTEDGAAMAQELGILEHGSSGNAPEPTPAKDAPDELTPLEIPGAFGTAVGAALRGKDLDRRSEPPPEIMGGEHVHERGLTGDTDIVIGFAEVREG